MNLQERIYELKRKLAEAEKSGMYVRLSHDSASRIIVQLEQLQQIRKKVPEVTKAIDALTADTKKRLDALESLRSACATALAWVSGFNIIKGGIRERIRNQLAEALAVAKDAGL